MRFYLSFNSDNYGKKEIDEPFNFYDVDFELKQKSDGMGRDISIAGGDIAFEFGDQRNHELKQIIYYNRKFGFESNVVLTIEIDEDNKYNVELDFATAETDDLTYFKCKCIEDSSLQIINARKSVKVDLFSDKSIDGDFIEPLVPENMLILSKPVYQTSQWKDDVETTTDFVAKYFINFARKPIQYEIESSYVPFVLGGDSASIKDNPLIEFQNNAVNLSIFLDLKINGWASNASYGIRLKYFKGSKADFNPLTGGIEIANAFSETGLTYTGVIDIPSVNRGEFLWIYAFIPSGISSFPVTRFYSYYYDVKVSLSSVSYNSVSKSLKLYDVMSQVIKSISGLNINSDRFIDYPDRLVNGNLLRGITDKPFYVSLEDLEKSITEFKGDYEIGSDGKIFFGIDEDFYTNNECGFFPNTQFSEMNKTYNPKHTVNEFHFMYKKFQSQKENEIVNSNDTIHGESKYSFFAKKVENKKVVEIEWIRDAFLLEEARRKALEITENTSYQNDDDLFVIDSIVTENDISFLESSLLEHTKDVVNNRLNLRSDGSVNFTALGIIVGSFFSIKTPDLNAGDYTVFAVSDSELQLIKTSSGAISTGANGVRQTSYFYTIEKETIPFTNYTNQGFTNIQNLNSGNNYSNLRRSVRRNINTYWNSYLAACNLYWKDKALQNTWYKNNPLCETTYNGDTVIEGIEINPNNPILTPVLYNDIVFANVDFTDFVTLQSNIRSLRGFIRAIDNNKRVVKIYPVNVKYSLSDRKLIIKGEEKYEPTYMTIDTSNDFILINNETRVYAVKYEIKDNKLYIYDENRQLLYNPVYWMEVSVNNAIPDSIEELEEWMSLLN